MTSKNSYNLERFKAVLPYLIAGVGTLALVFVGSLDKNNADSSLSLGNFTDSNYEVSVDQISELSVVANISDAFGFSSATDAASNYVSISSMYSSGQIPTSGKLEKPNITNISASRGVIEHAVEEGETLESIAAKYGLSGDQVRWSNGLKTADVIPGMILYIPSTPGIVYTVKAGDTMESIVSKYGSNAEEIIALNDLEVSGITEGSRIVIKNGVLPETERPEYVAPAIARRNYNTGTSNYSYSYTYLGNSASRTNATCNGSLGGGQCVTWAKIKRPDLDFLGNANRWDDMARASGHLVNRVPAPGTIFQTDSGWYGHVGYVESVNSDGSINVSERNYAGCRGGVLFSTIPAEFVGSFNYIH